MDYGVGYLGNDHFNSRGIRKEGQLGIHDEYLPQVIYLTPTFGIKIVSTNSPTSLIISMTSLYM